MAVRIYLIYDTILILFNEKFILTVSIRSMTFIKKYIQDSGFWFSSVGYLFNQLQAKLKVYKLLITIQSRVISQFGNT